MLINGAPVDDSLVLVLARNIRSANLAHKLRAGHRFRTELINLSNHERTLVLQALDETSPALKALRAQLVEHPAWRQTTRVT